MKEISYFVIFIIMTEREIECYFYTLVDMLYEKKKINNRTDTFNNHVL